MSSKQSQKTTKTTKTNARKQETQAKQAETVVVNTATVTTRDAFGNRLNTRAHVINEVIFKMKSDELLTCAEIVKRVHESESGKRYKEVHGYDVKAISNHLLFLVTTKQLVCESRKYRKLNADELKALSTKK